MPKGRDHFATQPLLAHMRRELFISTTSHPTPPSSFQLAEGLRGGCQGKAAWDAQQPLFFFHLGA